MLRKYRCVAINIIFVFVVICCSFAVEYLVSNYNEITDNDYSLTLNDSYHRQTGEFNEYFYDVDGKEISVVSLNYNSVTNYSYSIECESGEDTLSYTDNAYYWTNYAATNIGKKADTLLVKVPLDVQIEDIVITNVNAFNIPRFLVVFGILFLLGYLIKNARTGIKIERLFFFICMLCGLVIVFMVGPNLLSWDEQIHFGYSWDMSYLKQVDKTQASILFEELEHPNLNTIEEKNYVLQWLNNLDEVVETKSQDIYISYSKLVYLPQTLGLVIGKAINLPFVPLMYLGKITNLLVYALVFAYGIKKCKHTKYVLMVIGLQPTAVFMAASYSYDPFLISLVSVGMALLFEEYLSSDKLDVKRTMTGIIFVILGTLSKSIYIPLLMIVLFYDKNKFESKKQNVLFKLLVLTITVAVMSTFVAPALGSVVNGTVIEGDARGGDTSVSEQMKFIFTNPLKYTKILLSSWGSTLKEYLFGATGNVNFAYYIGNINRYTANKVYIVVLGVAVMFGNLYEKAKLPKSIRIYRPYSLLLVFGIMCLLSTAMYLSFTPVGYNRINGVQARYYIPLLFILSTICFNAKIKKFLNRKLFEILIISALIIVWLLIFAVIF